MYEIVSTINEKADQIDLSVTNKKPRLCSRVSLAELFISARRDYQI